MPTTVTNTPPPTSPPNGSFSGTSTPGDSVSRRSYTGELYGYYYSALSALGGPSEQKLADHEETYVLDEYHRGLDTNQWTNSMVRAVSYYTYRNRYPQPLANGADHDAGWGCMIRTGQMMMSEALRRVYKVKLPPQPLKKIKESELPSLASNGSSSTHILRGRSGGDNHNTSTMGSPAQSAGGNFTAHGHGAYRPHNNTNSNQKANDNGARIPASSPPASPVTVAARAGSGGGAREAESLPIMCGLTAEQSERFHKVAALFYDTPTAPFGIHQMTNFGATAAKVPVGEWFTPTALARTLCAIVANTPAATSPQRKSPDDVPAAESIKSRLAIVAAYDGVVYEDEIEEHIDQQKAVLLLIPVMLGMGTLDASYQKAFLKLLECPLSLGIVGGKPKQSLYFIGHQRETCFYLDPHTVQPAFLSPQTIGHRSGPRGNTSVSNVDPCMLLCFYFGSDIEHRMFQEFFFTELRPLTEYPLFAYQEQKPKPKGSIVDDVVDDMDFDDS